MAIYSRTSTENIIIGGSGPAKTNVLLNLIFNQLKLKLLLNTQMICKMFIKVLKNTI